MRLCMSADRQVLQLARAAKIPLSDSAEASLLVEIERMRSVDQEIAIAIGDPDSGKKECSDFYPAMGMRPASDDDASDVLGHVITFVNNLEPTENKEKFEIPGTISPEVWEKIRQWMNSLVGRAMGFWDQWRKDNAPNAPDLEFSAESACVRFPPQDEASPRPWVGFTCRTSKK